MIQINIRFPHLLIALFALLALVIGGQVVAGQEGDPNAPAAVTVQLGSAFTYQGYLEDEDGPIDGQSCDFQFSLYDAADGTTPLAGPLTRTTDLLAGTFTVILDFGNAFKGDARFLGIEARCPASSGDYTALTPHQSLTAVPYAMSLRPGATIAGTVPAGTGALNLSSSGDGLRVIGAGDNGLEVASATNSGLSIGIVGDDGVFIDRAGNTGGACAPDSLNNGVEVCTAENNGLVVGAAGGNGVSLSSAGGDGLYVNTVGGDGVFVNSAGDSGLEVQSAAGNGVWVKQATGHGAIASTASTDRYGGNFQNLGSLPQEGAGLYAKGNQGKAPDIILGANDGDASLAGDDGVISSDPAYAGSDIILRSNDNVIVTLNDDGNEDDGDFEVHNKYGDILFDVDDGGSVTSKGPYYAEYEGQPFMVSPVAFGYWDHDTQTLTATPNISSATYIDVFEHYDIRWHEQPDDGSEYIVIVTISDFTQSLIATAHAYRFGMTVRLRGIDCGFPPHPFCGREADFQFVVYKL